MTCETIANPMDKTIIEWFREGHKKPLSNGTAGRVAIEQAKGRSVLRIVHLQRQDEGYFLCKASNGIRNASIARMRLAFKFKPMITNKKSSFIAVEIGRDLRIVCKARGIPVVNFQWFDMNGAELGSAKNSTRQSNEVHSREHVIINKKSGSDVESFESQLTIKKIVVEDFGSRIMCKAFNELGHDYKVITIRLKGKPDPPENLTLNFVSDKSISISWDPGFNGGHVQFFRAKLVPRLSRNVSIPSDNLSSISETTNETSLSIDGLKPSHNYSLYLIAINAAGESSSEPLIFQTSEYDETSGSALVGGSLGAGSGKSPFKIALLLIILGISVAFANCAFIIFCIRYKNHKWLPGRNRIIERNSDSAKAQSNNVNHSHLNGTVPNHTSKQDLTESYISMNHFNHNEVANTIIADSLTHQSCSHAIITSDADVFCDCDRKSVEILYRSM